jgi:transketolase
MDLPVTLIGVGHGYGYADAGPTHNPVEDIAVMRTLQGIEIYSPGDSNMVKSVARECIDNPSFRYVRLERAELPEIPNSDFNSNGFQIISPRNEAKDVLIISESFMLQKASALSKEFESRGKGVTLLDCYRVHPLSPDPLLAQINSHEKVIVLEEQFKEGALSSNILEVINDHGVPKKILRLGLDHKYFFENGGRDHLHELSGLGEKEIFSKVFEERLHQL